jgi:hypothetical protein
VTITSNNMPAIKQVLLDAGPWFDGLKPQSMVITLDKHFGIYRLAKNQVVPHQMPPVA